MSIGHDNARLHLDSANTVPVSTSSKVGVALSRFSRNESLETPSFTPRITDDEVISSIANNDDPMVVIMPLAGV